MAGEEKVLTQAEIDALVSRVPSKPMPPPKAHAEVKPEIKAKAPEPAPKPLEPETKAEIISPLPEAQIKAEIVQPPAASEFIPRPIEPVKKARLEPPELAPEPEPKMPEPVLKPIEAVRKTREESPPPPVFKPAPVSALPKAKTAKYEKYTSSEVGNIQSTVADLARQVAKMTNAMQKLDSVEIKIGQLYTALKPDPSVIQNLENRLDEISAALAEMKQRYDLQAEFQCSHCKSRQTMAMHVKCTQCGEETWMGWWPEGDKNHKHK
jgi:Zn finger protein HypA/HybF involved in hydrogenase expression